MIHNYTVITFDKIDSTNAEAIRLAKAGVDENYAILAQTQTSGRGRNNRGWCSPRGNLYASLLLKFYKDPELLPLLSFVVALAVYDCIQLLRVHNVVMEPKHSVLQTGAIAGVAITHDHLMNRFGIVDRHIKIKWPNDILVNNKKISGILLESIKVDNNNYLIIGVGININYHPTNIDQMTTSLAAENFQLLTAEAMLEFFISHFEKYYKMWLHEGFSSIKNLWCARAYKLHQQITVRINHEVITGTFLDIDDMGRMVIELPHKQIMFLSAAELLG